MAKDSINPVRGLLFLLALIGEIALVYISPFAVVLSIPLLYCFRFMFAKIALLTSCSVFLAYVWIIKPQVLQKITNFYSEYFSFPFLYDSFDTYGFSSIASFFIKNEFVTILNYVIIPTFLYAFLSCYALTIMNILIMPKDYKKELLKKRHESKKVDFSRAKHSHKKMSVPLGVNLWTNGKDTISIPHNLLNRHVCLVGTTGSGKTVTLYNFIINALLFDKAIVFVDGKGDPKNIEKFQEACSYFQRPCRVITLDGQAGYNPFATGTPTELTDKIISMSDWSEEHYRLTATRFIQLLIRYMQFERIPCNLPNIIKYSDIKTLTAYHMQRHQPAPRATTHEADQVAAHDELPSFDMVPSASGEESGTPGQGNGGRITTEADELLEKIRGIEAKSIQGIQARIAALAEGDMRHMLSAADSLDLSEAIESREAVLFSLDSLRYPAQSKALGRLVTNDIKSCVSRHAKNGSAPVGLFFDEFNVFASHEVIDIVNKSRSAGFEAVLSFQSLSDIDKLDSGEALRRQIVQNCNSLIVQLQNDSHDAEELSSLFGTEAAVSATVQVDEAAATGMQSMRRVHEFIVHPDDIKRLGVGQAFVKISGLGTAKVQILPN